jgi:hypothetical protein
MAAKAPALGQESERYDTPPSGEECAFRSAELPMQTFSSLNFAMGSAQEAILPQGRWLLSFQPAPW